MPTYTTDQIIGKALIGKEPVNLYRNAQDNASVVYTVPSGQPVGVVESYLAPGPGRNSLYWQFRDNSGRAYYSEHRPGRYNIEALTNQGALTLEEQKKAEEEKNLTTTDKIIKAGSNILLLIGGFAILMNFLKKK
jgi:hypothetical protein